MTFSYDDTIRSGHSAIELQSASTFEGRPALRVSLTVYDRRLAAITLTAGPLVVLVRSLRRAIKALDAVEAIECELDDATPPEATQAPASGIDVRRLAIEPRRAGVPRGRVAP